jgi:RimJ/RimL family protein N-acetyltransferase
MKPSLASQQTLPDASGRLDTGSLLLEWAEAPWDTAVFGLPVLQINRLEVRTPAADQDMVSFENTRDRLRSPLVSCRLSHEQLRESMFLEVHGFRFIEMLYQPEMENLDGIPVHQETGLSVWPANEQDLPVLMEIAGSAFHNERFHVDPRLDSRLGDQRYRNWIANSLTHPSQRLYAIRDGNCLVAFFVTELLPDGTCYWHLNAVAPGVQGKGYGLRAWLTMLRHARDSGARRVRTSIAARNHRALNLYARLGFRFSPPLMTFHWVRPS